MSNFTRKSLLMASAALICFPLVSAEKKPPKKWEGTIADVAKDETKWQILLKTLIEQNKPYSALAAAIRMQILFSDVASKESAYRAMISLIELGYPYPIRGIFGTADLEPTGDYQFVNSYNFYKGLANQEKGVERWAEHYFERVDKENFHKFQFLQALQSYGKKDFVDAEAKLKKLLSRKYEREEKLFLSKISRTLARIYFEKQEYLKALEIYQTYLLKLNPVMPSDWLEAAWALYHLKRYDEALGYLYNLEPPSGQDSNLEKYVLRALIYREFCSSESIQQLVKTFEKRYLAALESIKGGVPLNTIKGLREVFVQENQMFLEIHHATDQLSREARSIASVPSDLRNLAKHLYETELASFDTRIRLYEDEALNRTAAQLLTLHENIKFLRFDVVREMYSPESVFQKIENEDKKAIIEETADNRFLIKWRHTGGYWRDERMKYKAMLATKCLK